MENYVYTISLNHPLDIIHRQCPITNLLFSMMVGYSRVSHFPISLGLLYKVHWNSILVQTQCVCCLWLLAQTEMATMKVILFCSSKALSFLVSYDFKILNGLLSYQNRRIGMKKYFDREIGIFISDGLIAGFQNLVWPPK